MNQNELIRSSAAEYLTYIAASGEEGIEIRYQDENIWLTQKMLSSIYEVGLPTINHHINQIFNDNELDKNSTIRNFRIVQKEGNRSVSRDVAHYNLQMIIAVGYKVNNEKAVQFRKWANQIVKDYTINSKIHKYDVIIAKNYLSQEEISMLERLVSAYLDLAEMQAKRHIPMTMSD